MSEAAVATDDTIEEEQSPQDAADSTIRTHMYVALGAGAIPVPTLDLVAITGTQMNMIRKLSEIYGVTFSENAVRNIIGALVGGILPMGVAASVFSWVKAVPALGTGVGLLALPVLAGASTYALGKVVVQHLEAGGTFMNLDPEKVREHFQEEFKVGKSKAKAKD
jgi:uncharacterized protein (DUF697 family)